MRAPVSTPGIGCGLRGLALAALATAWVTPGVAAQVTTPPPATGHRLEVVDSGAVVVASTLRAPSGTADDPPGLEGLTHTVVEAQRRALSELPGVLAVEAVATRWEVRITLVTTPAAAAAADRALHSGASMLQGLPPALAAARERFAFTAETPAAEVELEAARLFAGFGAAWARPPRGSAATVEAITPAVAVARWDALLETPWVEARVAPPDAVGDPAASAPLPGRAGRDSVEARSSAAVWTAGDRQRIVRDVTNMWIVAAFPIPADLSRTSLDHLVHRIEEILSPVPGDPALIAAGVEVARLPGGDVLVVRATVLPAAAARWEARIRGLPSDITPPFDPDFFRWERRRFRAHLLLRDAAPAARSARIAADLLEGGEVRRLAEEAWELAPDDLANAAGRLGPPRILVLGPDVDDESAGNGGNF